jgi:hypothetical protein
MMFNSQEIKKIREEVDDIKEIIGKPFATRRSLLSGGCARQNRDIYGEIGNLVDRCGELERKFRLLVDALCECGAFVVGGSVIMPPDEDGEISIVDLKEGAIKYSSFKSLSKEVADRGAALDKVCREEGDK